VEALRAARGWGSHIFQTFNSQMAARLSALRAGRFLPPGRFLVIISVRGWVDPRAIVWLEGLGKLKEKKTYHPGLEPATFQLVAQCINQLRYRMPPDYRQDHYNLCQHQYNITPAVKLPLLAFQATWWGSVQNFIQPTSFKVHFSQLESSYECTKPKTAKD
jgi:hypothetical protein